MKLKKKATAPAALVVGVVVIAATAAMAAVSATDGGNTVTVSASSATTLPGGQATSGTGAGRRSGAGSTVGAAGTSTGTRSSMFGPSCVATGLTRAGSGVPGVTSAPGAAGTWYLMACSGWSVGVAGSRLVWVPAGVAATPAPAAAAADPSVLAAQAERTIRLPAPAIRMNPPTGIVMLPTWLWVDPSIWHPYSATASAGDVRATALVTPISVTWDMDDGSAPVVCRGPGTPYRADLPAASQRTDCSFVYHRSSAGQPSLDGVPNDGAYVVTATVTWSVAWSSSLAGVGGAMPPLVTESQARFRVEQVQSVDVFDGAAQS